MATDGHYTKVKSRFWDDEKVIAWDDDTKLLALYVTTCKHNNILGCYVLPLNYIEADLRWPAKRLAKPFAKLLEDRFIQYDELYRLLFVCSYLVHNPIDNSNQVVSAQKRLGDLPNSLILAGLKEFIERFNKPLYKPLTEQLGDALSREFGEGYAEQYKEGYANTVYRNRNRNRNRNRIPSLPPLPTCACFAAAYELYPKHAAKEDALKAWKQVDGDSHIDAIMDAIAKQSRSPNWLKDDRKYVPLFASWLRGKRWEDETDAKPQGTIGAAPIDYNAGLSYWDDDNGGAVADVSGHDVQSA